MDSDASSDGESGRSPREPDGPESPDDEGAVSCGSRPPSPDCDPKNESDAESGGASPDSISPRSRRRSPASPPRRSASPTSTSLSPQRENESEDKKWSPKSDSRSRQDSLSPNAIAKSEDSSRRSNFTSPLPSNRDSPRRSSRESPRPSMRDSRHRDRSDSSVSSRDSSPRERSKYANNPPTEEISEGEMESEQEDQNPDKESTSENIKNSNKDESNMNISHEDLSDVSDLESMGEASEDDSRPKKSPIRAPDLSDSRESPPKSEPKINGNSHKEESIKSPVPMNGNAAVEVSKFEKLSLDKASKTEDAEEQLDFEAEEGECLETPIISKSSENKKNESEKKMKDDGEGSGAASSLEEGEVTDDEDRRPEETEPRPVCRFYSRGQCTWGVSCRFLHPGVTDKGNYTMFDMVRTMPASYTQHHPISHHIHPHVPAVASTNHSVLHMSRAEPPQSESAWERGLRTAKEMMRKACKRKEQDTDFEEKKMHLSLSGGAGGRGGSLGPGGEEDDADLAAYAGFPPPDSPPPAVKREREEFIRLPERRPKYEDPGLLYSSRERTTRYERIPRVSASPPHRGSASAILYDDKLDDKNLHHKSRRGRTTREVIVQRAPGASNSGNRGDEWADPWMRGSGTARSPGARRTTRDKSSRRRGKRNYSTGSSCSSSSSSRSSSRSSNSSRSGSLGRKASRRRAHSPAKPRRGALSPSVIVQERRAATARAVAMNPPAPSARKRIPSPAATRQHAANPPAPHSTKTTVDEFGRTKPIKAKQRSRKLYSKSSSSASDSSSSSSESESETHSSSSSDSSGTRRNKTGPSTSRGLEKKQAAKAAGSRLLSPKYLQAHLQKKDTNENDGRKDNLPAKKRPALSPPGDDSPAKKPVSRREELLKQLKAVEDAIARKRSKP